MYYLLKSVIYCLYNPLNYKFWEGRNIYLSLLTYVSQMLQVMPGI